MLLPNPKNPIYSPDTWERNNFRETAYKKLEDSFILYQNSRYMASMYLGGYAIECAFQALYCYQSNLNRSNIRGVNAHDISFLLTQLNSSTSFDINSNFPIAWNNLCHYWGNLAVFKLRYNSKNTIQNDSKVFLCSVLVIHEYLSSEIDNLSIPPGMIRTTSRTSYFSAVMNIHTMIRHDLVFSPSRF